GVEEEIGNACTGRVSQDAASPAQEGCRAREGAEGKETGEGQGSGGRGPRPGGRSCARVFSGWRRREVGRPADGVPRRGAFRSDPKGGYRRPGEATAAVWPRAPVRCETFRPLVGEGPWRLPRPTDPRLHDRGAGPGHRGRSPGAPPAGREGVGEEGERERTTLGTQRGPGRGEGGHDRIRPRT